MERSWTIGLAFEVLVFACGASACGAKQPQITNVYHYHGGSAETATAAKASEFETQEATTDPLREALVQVFRNLDRTQLEFQQACPQSVAIDEDGSEWCMTSETSGFSVRRNGFIPFVSALSFEATLEQARRIKTILDGIGEPTYDQELDALRWDLEEAELLVTTSDRIMHIALRRDEASTPDEPTLDPRAVLGMLEGLLGVTGDSFSAACVGDSKQWPGKQEYAGWSFHVCSYNLTKTDLGHVTVFLNVAPDGITQSVGLMFLMEHFARFQATAQEVAGRVAEEREEDVRTWRLPNGTLKLMPAPRTGWGVALLERSGVRL